MGWLATTHSGTTYRMDEDGFVLITPASRQERPISFRVFRLLISDDEGGWVTAPYPEVGKCLFIDNNEQWRKSTAVAKLEEWDG